MTNTKFLLLVSVCVFFNENAQAAGVKGLTFDSSGSSLVNIIYTPHTPSELKPISSFNLNSDNAIKLASVCALGSGSGKCNETLFDSSGNNFKLDNRWQCTEEGYTITSCPAGKKGEGACPYVSGYYKECVCDTSVYTIRNSSTCGSLATIENCTDGYGSYYKCTCDTSIMTTCSGSNQYASKTPSCVMNGVSYVLNAECVTCHSPTVLNSAKTACECPSAYKQCNSSNNEVGSGESCSVGSVTKYKTCTCPTNYKQCDLGGDVGAKKCTMGGRDYFSACKTCQNLGTHASCPTGYACTYESCSKKYYITGCAVGNVDVSQTQCGWYRCWGIVRNK